MNSLTTEKALASVVVRDGGQIAVSVVYRSADNNPYVTAKVGRNRVAEIIADAMGRCYTRDVRVGSAAFRERDDGDYIPEELCDTVATVLAEFVDDATKERFIESAGIHLGAESA